MHARTPRFVNTRSTHEYVRGCVCAHARMSTEKRIHKFVNNGYFRERLEGDYFFLLPKLPLENSHLQKH